MLRPEFYPDKPVEEEYDPDAHFGPEVDETIREYVRAAVQLNMKRKDLIDALFVLAGIPLSKTQQFLPVTVENKLSRNEILIWMHIAAGGSAEPKHISRKLRISIRWVEKALTVLEEKNIVVDEKTL